LSAPDDRHPESGDASHFDFDDLVLDEDFIRNATISEASATARVERKREQQVRRSSRFPRPQVRRVQRRWREWTAARPDDHRSRPAPDAPRMREWTRAQWSAVVVSVVLAGVFVWALTGSHSGAHATTVVSPASASAQPPGADPVGSCLGAQPGGNKIAPNEVLCTALHSVEITGYAPITALSPTAAALTSVESACQQSALKYAGGTLPSTVRGGYVLPTVDQWGVGDHSAECTIFQVDASGGIVPVTGTMRNSEN